MSTGETGDAELYGDPRQIDGLEAYPYASIQAEKRIKSISGLLSVVTVGFLVAGLYLALFSPQVGLGGLLTLVGFIGLMVVPVVAKRMRRAALARESGG
ncbi:hypothetical protein [Euzebya tangerina]|uniref:hypothetical protein n=1 Tax=Euzebya tangerina TaxID=591198 RepID=UPI000E30BDD0|nr:hypothetical protein [Euzebya tangerina]